MKKLLLVLMFVLAASGPAHAARSLSPGGMQNESYVDLGVERSIEVTLSGTPNTDTTITIPDDAKGIRFYPRGANNHIRFAVYQSNDARTLANVATDSDGTVAAADFAIGGIAKAEMWETRLLPGKLTGSTTRVCKIRSTVASVVVDVEVF